MSNFDTCFSLLMGNEGGYVNNPADPGGETMWGITKRVAVRWGYQGAMQDLPQDTAKSIAKSCYWDPLNLDQLPLAIAFQCFDVNYNGGFAAKWLQASLGLIQDGVIGPQTIAAARMSNQWQVVALFNAQRLRYYTGLKNPTFMNGWANRVAGNLEKGGLQ